jgi:hypothetical protein
LRLMAAWRETLRGVLFFSGCIPFLLLGRGLVLVDFASYVGTILDFADISCVKR